MADTSVGDASDGDTSPDDVATDASDLHDASDASDLDTTPDISSEDVADTEGPETPTWRKHIQGDGAQRAGDVVVDGQGNIFVTGNFTQSLDLGGGALTSAGEGDVFLAKFDADGNHLWSKRFGGSAADMGHGLAVDSQNNIVLVGEFGDTADFGGGAVTSAGASDIFVAKFDPNGAHLWSHHYGAAGEDGARAVAVDSQDRVLVTGLFVHAVDFGGGELATDSDHATDSDGFVLQLDTGGGHLWSKSVGARAPDVGRDIVVDSQDNIFIGGSFRAEIDLGDGVRLGENTPDGFVTKWTADGDFVWGQNFGDEFDDVTTGLAVDSQDNVIAVGYFNLRLHFGNGNGLLAETNNDEEIFVIRFDGSTGEFQWGEHYGGHWDNGMEDRAHDVAVGPQDNISMVGTFEGRAYFGGLNHRSRGGKDAFAAGFDSEGDYLWSESYGGADEVRADAVAVTAQGAPVVFGSFEGTADFDTDDHWAASGDAADLFLLTLPAP
ncbi:hypothetical protein FIV42_01905 [Persicimonas caeni]|uniref:Uncharacterized protein n=1 Tax=Persicimonas caeni TaxID=2292766 RepID=A0A4Y6PMU8_PERCE|nr:hypothetical protein [Persicimonas caeni]QDG49533.1 hypothetical protein FIV42_01905 [Persicimonas caeni]QED30754.1 hypothetical protein FRD00_01900 [Persicimonas caeni]